MQVLYQAPASPPTPSRGRPGDWPSGRRNTRPRRWSGAPRARDTWLTFPCRRDGGPLPGPPGREGVALLPPSPRSEPGRLAVDAAVLGTDVGPRPGVDPDGVGVALVDAADGVAHGPQFGHRRGVVADALEAQLVGEPAVVQ